VPARRRAPAALVHGHVAVHQAVAEHAQLAGAHVPRAGVDVRAQTGHRGNIIPWGLRDDYIAALEANSKEKVAAVIERSVCLAVTSFDNAMRRPR
jgi:hypothetical protein